MKELAPLLQTLLWVTLIGWIVWRYQNALDDLIAAIKRRLDSGGGLKVGPLEFTPLRPLDADEQKQKINREISQLVAPAEGRLQADDTSIQIRDSKSLRQAYLRAEDLALRQIQSEFGVPIGRQVKWGVDLQFDGAFALNGTLHVIEVKYSINRLAHTQVLQFVEQFFASVGQRNWKNFKLIYAIVIDREDIDVEAERKGIAELVKNAGYDVLVRCYRLSELEKTIGVQE
jgi:hypothetical protein